MKPLPADPPPQGERRPRLDAAIRRVVDSALVYAARTLGVLGCILFLRARAALADHLHAAFAR